MTNLRRWHRSRRKADAFDEGRNRPHRASGLVDDDLTLEAQEAAKTAQMSFIEHTGVRAASAFLRTEDFDDVRQHLAPLLADMMQECLPPCAS